MRIVQCIALLLTVGLCGPGFAQVAPPNLTSDFAPPHGVLIAGRFGESSWEERLLTATSKDGLTFERTHNVITDQARSPNLVVADGLLYLYYSGAMNGTGRRGALAVAISADRGKTWVFKHVDVRAGDRMMWPYAPDVQVLRDGRFRLSFSEDAMSPSILYAEGKDGIHFTSAGTVYSRTGPYGSLTIGSLTVPIGEDWHAYLRHVNADMFGFVNHGFSSDGDRFTFAGELKFSDGPHPCHPTSAVSLGDGSIRFYGSPDETPGGVRSFLTRDGVKFEPEPGMRLALDLATGVEKDFVKDAAVARLADGTYFMVYVTDIP